VRIGFLLWSSNYGGAESWSVGLASELQHSCSAQVGVIVVGRRGAVADQLHERGVPHECLGVEPGRQLLFRASELGRAVARLHAHVLIIPNSGLLARAVRGCGYKGAVIAIEHGSLLQMGRIPFHKRLVRRLEAYMSRLDTDAIVAPSDFVVEVLGKGARTKRTVRIYPGVNPSHFSPLPTERRRDVVTIGFAGRLISGKGAETLIRAVAEMRPLDDWRLQIAGVGPLRRTLESMVDEFGLQRRVRFLGPVGEMPLFWQECDLAVVPSDDWVESFGMCALEAMACGIPAVVSRQGGLAEIVDDGMTGAWFPPKDVRALSAILERYTRDQRLREEHGRAARQRCLEMFPIDRSAKELQSLIQSVCGMGDSESVRLTRHERVLH
jgi:glycosyltransferase involved in cell wall biosynthesis